MFWCGVVSGQIFLIGIVYNSASVGATCRFDAADATQVAMGGFEILPAQEPVPANTTPTVRTMIFRSSHTDQFSMYARSSMI